MKEKIKKNIISIFAFTLGIILPSIIAQATTYISGGNVGYNGALSSDNIQDAIDELYTLSRTKTKIKAWEYHETGSKKCINGEEDTCVSTTCYKTGSTCSMGTVIKYYVNDNEFHYFYVLRDVDGVITMQQRENTIRNISWISKEDYITAGGTESDYGTNGRNEYGPITILNALEKSTSTWTNVDILDYTPGVTNLYDNPNVSCTYTDDNTISCDNKSYTNSKLGTRKARARMITIKEAIDTGCQISDNGSGSCPDYMHNYLYSSTTYGGSYNNKTTNESGIYDYNYWTMSFINYSNERVFIVMRYGYLGDGAPSRLLYGARAVVEITKSNL